MKHVILMLLASAAVTHVAPALAEDPTNSTEEESLGVSSEASVDESADDSADESASDESTPEVVFPPPPPFRRWVCFATPINTPWRRFPGYGWTRMIAGMNATRLCQESGPFPHFCRITGCYQMPRI